jgi:uncharacterized protein
MIDASSLKFLPSQYIIDGYGQGGFRFANMSHQGGLLSLPSGMSAWSTKLDAFTEADFAREFFERVFPEAEEIDMFLLGCGTGLTSVPIELRQSFKDHKIALDLMPTAAAARTYNILLSEGRRVACGLIAVA